MGTGTSFTDTGLSQSTQYFYRVYTYDKAFNYSAADIANGMTLAPTAAPAQVSGRVTQPNGRGIFRARVTMTDSQGNIQTEYTNQQGYFTFTSVPGGETYIFTAWHLRYQFEQPSQIQFIGEDNDGINFVGTSVSGVQDVNTRQLEDVPPKGQ
jgi:hypothetical protein